VCYNIVSSWLSDSEKVLLIDCSVKKLPIENDMYLHILIIYKYYNFVSTSRNGAGQEITQKFYLKWRHEMRIIIIN
jgi:hypothetical protein